MALELLRRPGSPGDRSVAEFVVDHFGHETLDYLAEPLLSGVYGGDPAKLSVASVLPRFLEMEAKTGSLGRAVMNAKRPPSSTPLFRTLKRGLGSMIERLASGLTVRHENVEAIEPGFRVRAGGDWIEADHLILACPAWSAAQLVSGVDGDLAKSLGEIEYSSSLTLSLVYDASMFDGKRAGFGFLVPACERRRLAACTFVGAKFPNRAPEGKVVLRCFFGGAGDGAILFESDDTVSNIARDELRRILGLTAAPMYSTISRWPKSMAQYTVGHSERIREIRERTSRIPGLHLAGNAYEGIGIPDCIRTGRAAAKAIVDKTATSVRK
jgi:oxygen-dependent protoporphyrinogen oxidase